MKKITCSLRKILKGVYSKCLNLNSAQAQTVLMLIGIIVAGILGYEQNVISDRQNDINQKLLELNMKPILHIFYDEPNKKLTIANKGQFTLGFKAMALPGEKFEADQEPMIVPSEGELELDLKDIWQKLINGETVNFNQKKITYLAFRIQDESLEKYLLVIRIYFGIANNQEINVKMQSLGVKKDKWISDAFIPNEPLPSNNSQLNIYK